MMEKYKVESSGLKKNKSIKLGSYFDNVYKKHVDSYGEYGARNIRDNIVPTFEKALEQYEDKNKNNNMLLVGKVQSGKTSNLEMFTALALDNGYNMVVIYGGYDNTLLSQTKNRFKETFDIPDKIDYSKPSPVIFSSDESAELLTVDNETIEDLLTFEKPIFIISMKRPNALNKVNDILDRIDKTELKAFIIDDEGDQASLNTKKNKEEDASATYASICNMKSHLGNPLYLSVTATPHALVLLDDFSELIPNSLRVISPGKGYCGADAYHLYNDDVIEIIDEEDQNDLSNGKFPNSLREAIMHYIISNAILYIRRCYTSEMIVHSHRTIRCQERVYALVHAYIEILQDMVYINDSESLETVKKEFKKAYIKMFKEEVISQYEFDNLWDIIINNIINRVHIILKNSTGQATQGHEYTGRYNIYIGGDLLQRGVTFQNLVTTYFSRWAKAGGNMDTNLQRARWFGYREKYIDICKIFTTSKISREFTNLSEMETDLWDQFRAIEEGEMEIGDILIKAEGEQDPTRKCVVSYKKFSYNGWIRQRVGIFDGNQVNNNNNKIEDLLNNSNFNDTSVGRKDGKKTAEYAYIKKEKLCDLIDDIQGVFDIKPFNKGLLKKLIKKYDEIPIIVMKDDEKEIRKRSFYPNREIYELQQGAGNSDSEKAIYQGDKQVIIEKNKVNVQIHKILPMQRNENTKDKKELPEYTQYMFAIYVPKEENYVGRENL